MNTFKANTHITRTQGDNLRKAWFHCDHYGFPLNATINIHFALAGGSGHYVQRRQNILGRLRKWVRHKGVFPGDPIFACVWSMENNDKGKDAHLHAALHLPANLSVSELQEFLEDVVKGIEGAVLVGDVHDNGWLRYMLKGCHPSDYDYFSIRHNKKHRVGQGVIYGKRCGVSQDISTKKRNERIARNKTNFSAIKFPTLKQRKSPISGNTHAQGMVQLREKTQIHTKSKEIM
jgi:hypothetical protein